MRNYFKEYLLTTVSIHYQSLNAVCEILVDDLMNIDKSLPAPGHRGLQSRTGYLETNKIGWGKNGLEFIFACFLTANAKVEL